jgi:hypothetical protein
MKLSVRYYKQAKMSFSQKWRPRSKRILVWGWYQREGKNVRKGY